MTKVVKIKTGSKFEEHGSYSRIVAVDNWIFVSNTAGRNPVSKLSIPGCPTSLHRVSSSRIRPTPTP